MEYGFGVEKIIHVMIFSEIAYSYSCAGADGDGDSSGDSHPSGSDRPPSAGEGLVLVASSFTEEAGHAVELAGRIAKARGARLLSVYVVTPGDETPESKIERHLHRQLRRVPNRVESDILLRRGEDIVESISTVIREQSPELVFLGSHSARNRMTFKDSKSMQIVRRGQVPYVLVQNEFEGSGLEHVVLPLDYTDEDVRDFAWLRRLHECHGCYFHIAVPEMDSMEEEMNDYLESNLDDLRNLLDSVGARYDEHTLGSDQEFSLSIVEYAYSLEADMIVLTTSVDPRAENSFILEPHARRVIQRADSIPVMLVNPKV